MFLLICLLPLVAGRAAFSLIDIENSPFSRAKPHSKPTTNDDKSLDVSLANLLDTHEKFSQKDLEYYLTIANTHPEYVPVPLKTITKDMPTDVKQEIVSIVNQIEDKKVVVPNNEKEILQFVQSKCPLLYQRLQTALDQVMDIIGDLSDSTKEKFDKWWKKAFAAVSGDNEGRANRIAKYIADFDVAFSKAESKTKQDVAKASPEAYKLITSDFAHQFAKAARSFAAAGLTADIRKLGANFRAPQPGSNNAHYRETVDLSDDDSTF